MDPKFDKYRSGESKNMVFCILINDSISTLDRHQRLINHLIIFNSDTQIKFVERQYQNIGYPSNRWRLSIGMKSIHDIRSLDARDFWTEDVFHHESWDSKVCIIYDSRNIIRFQYDMMRKRVIAHSLNISYAHKNNKDKRRDRNCKSLRIHRVKARWSKRSRSVRDISLSSDISKKNPYLF